MTAGAVASPPEVKRRYEGSDDRPLGPFLGLLGGYGAGVTAVAGLLRWRRKRLPDQVPPQDLVLGALATHKLSRLLAKDPVSSPFRAPFTKFEGQSGEAEVAEEVIGTGWQHALGELVTCPFCLDVWVATAFILGYIAHPRLTRTVASGLAIVAGADVLQFGYDALQSSD
jgi:hypothetical protein